jgi:uncharacterized protein YggE
MRKSVLFGLGALVAVSALFLACGGGDDKTSDNGDGQTQNIRIGKGLSVANLSSGQSAATGGDDTALPESAGLSGSAAHVADGSGNRPASIGYAGGKGGDSISAQQASPTANTGITVQGYGSATADADSAIVEFGFGSNGYGGVKPLPYPEGGSDIQPSGTAEPITGETLQPVIDALVGAGVSAEDIELLSQSYYYDAYYSSATLRATINNIDIVDAAVEAAQAAAKDVEGSFLQGTNVNYTLQNCETLEHAAVQAAVEDAGDRAAVLADVLNVTLGSVSGASDYSWYNYGTGCGSDSYSPYPIAYTPWRIGGSADGTVQVVSNISVTYAFD